MQLLREFRISKGVSQPQMAIQLGVSQSLYEKIERGHVQASRAFMQKLKKLYPQINIDEMFFNTDELQKAVVK